MLILISLILIATDHESKSFHHFRESAEVVVLPLDYGVDLPVRAVESVISNVTTRENLMKDNTRLKAENSLLQAKVQQMLAVESDNKALMQLLQSSTKAGGKVLEAKIVAIATQPSMHQIVLNKGSNDGAFIGQPVLDVNGVMGQVVQVNSLVSRVMLLTDAQSAIPVQDSRSGVRSIAVGDPENKLLTLKDMPQTTDLKQGDLLVTSAMGGRYPYGYPVAKIVSIVNDPNDRFSLIKAKPLAHLDRSRLVLLVWPGDAALEKSIQAILPGQHKTPSRRPHEKA